MGRKFLITSSLFYFYLQFRNISDIFRYVKFSRRKYRKKFTHISLQEHMEVTLSFSKS